MITMTCVNIVCYLTACTKLKHKYTFTNEQNKNKAEVKSMQDLSKS